MLSSSCMSARSAAVPKTLFYKFDNPPKTEHSKTETADMMQDYQLVRKQISVIEKGVGLNEMTTDG